MIKKLLQLATILTIGFFPLYSFASLGDIYYGSSTYPFTVALPASTSGTILQSQGTSTAPKWVATSSLGITGGGGTNYFTNSGTKTFLNTGSILQFPTFQATSTSGTSTIANALGIGISATSSVKYPLDVVDQIQSTTAGGNATLSYANANLILNSSNSSGQPMLVFGINGSALGGINPDFQGNLKLVSSGPQGVQIYNTLDESDSETKSIGPAGFLVDACAGGTGNISSNPFEVDCYGAIQSAISPDGSYISYAGSGNIVIGPDADFGADEIDLVPDGSASFANGSFEINADGSANFSGGNAVVSSAGVITAPSITLTSVTSTSTIAGSLGIGTSTPADALDVNGGIYSEAKKLSTSTASTATLNLQAANNVMYFLTGTTSVAISITNGTTTIGKCITLNVASPLSGVIGSTTFVAGTGTGAIVYGGASGSPGNSVVNGSTDQFSICSEMSYSSSTPETVVTRYNYYQ